ncbi:hypothetical protein COU58_00395 [Candidatus Pacearchaeota archaeon CG10_big_fil_rev_8_21_14_0_10_32_42]|nr:MAG: hypothetical protein COU58_00395 [Candidatus Pacearchaeota archaeon CG10_big_fil_rev_8_21_14_0_10_32_42]
MTLEKLEKKLGVWGIDVVVGEDNQIFAKNYYCVSCYKQNKKIPAEVFWPCIDPDIPSAPYCRPCKEKNVMEILLG